MRVPHLVREEMAFRRREAIVDGVRLSAVDDGPARAGETLLFVHGNPAWSFVWRRLLRAGLRAGHRVLAPDLAGFGLSGKPEDPGYHTLERHVANLEAVVERWDLRGLTLVLHDWGGPVGMGLAARHPDRVRRIVLTNTTAFAPRKARAFSPWHRVFATRAGGALGVRLNLVARTAFRWGTRQPLPPAVRDAYLWPLRDRGARIAATALVRMVPDGPEHPTAAALRTIEAGYGSLQDKPVLVLWADRDRVMPPRRAERWLRAFPKADVRHLSQAGHFWQEDDPEAFERPILEFPRG